MNKEFFGEQLGRLERLFNKGKELDRLTQDEYFIALRNFREVDFIKAIDDVVQTHRPYMDHVFPSIATILGALNDIIREQPRASPEDLVDINFCDQCRNRGMYLEDNETKFCDCLAGRKAEVIFRFWPNRKRIAAEQALIKTDNPPHHGLRERNPLGFWEDTQVEHDKWMAKKRVELEQMKKREEEREARLAAAKRVTAPETISRIVQETVRQIDETRPLREAIQEEVLEHEPGEDEIPF
jgi:hypothetical protein